MTRAALIVACVVGIMGAGILNADAGLELGVALCMVICLTLLAGAIALYAPLWRDEFAKEEPKRMEPNPYVPTQQPAAGYTPFYRPPTPVPPRGMGRPSGGVELPEDM